MNQHQFADPKPLRWDDLDTDQRADAIKALHGLTSDAIAEMLGTTRNAVLGLAFRRKIPMGEHATKRSTAFQPGREVAPETWAPLGQPTAKPTRKQCCWPVEEATGSAQMFCGQAKSHGSYCATHGRMAYARRPGDHPYIDMLRDRSVPPEVTVEEAVSLVRPVVKKKRGAE